METYIINYADDLKYVKSKWLVRDIRQKGNINYGFETKKDALKFAYNLITKNYQNKKNGNIIGLLKLTKMPYDPKNPIVWEIGWYNGHPAYYVDDYWVKGFYRIMSDGSVKGG